MLSFFSFGMNKLVVQLRITICVRACVYELSWYTIMAGMLVGRKFWWTCNVRRCIDSLHSIVVMIQLLLFIYFLLLYIEDDGEPCDLIRCMIWRRWLILVRILTSHRGHVRRRAPGITCSWRGCSCIASIHGSRWKVKRKGPGDMCVWPCEWNLTRISLTPAAEGSRMFLSLSLHPLLPIHEFLADLHSNKSIHFTSHTPNHIPFNRLKDPWCEVKFV